MIWGKQCGLPHGRAKKGKDRITISYAVWQFEEIKLEKNIAGGYELFTLHRLHIIKGEVEDLQSGVCVH